MEIHEGKIQPAVIFASQLSIRKGGRKDVSTSSFVNWGKVTKLTLFSPMGNQQKSHQTTGPALTKGVFQTNKS